MRRILVVAVACVVLVACDPAPTITATPSTLRPGCTDTVTVTGTTAPVGAILNVVIERQAVAGGEWRTYAWLPSGAPGERVVDLRGKTDASGAYSITFFRPLPGSATLRLRVRGMKKLADTGWSSASFYIKPPTGCVS